MDEALVTITGSKDKGKEKKGLDESEMDELDRTGVSLWNLSAGWKEIEEDGMKTFARCRHRLLRQITSSSRESGSWSSVRVIAFQAIEAGSPPALKSEGKLTWLTPLYLREYRSRRLQLIHSSHRSYPDDETYN